MTETAIEEIEQQFVPFDTTPDMYEVTCDNDDYAPFLKEFYDAQGGGSNLNVNNSNVEDDHAEDDPEFVYCPDESDKQTKDPEELRNDKATKITKKEVAELMAELLDCANNAKDDTSKKKLAKRKKTPLPGDIIYEAIKEHTENAIVKEIADSASIENLEDEIKYEDPPTISDHERKMIARQIEQHIQLVTQMSLLASHNSNWAGVRSQCDQMLAQLMATSLATPHSLAGQSNLVTSLSVIRDWDSLGFDPTVITKNKNSKKHKKINMIFDISLPLYRFMSNQLVFYYPAFLPLSALCTDQPRIVWTASEDHLLALAMKATILQTKKPGLVELSFALRTKYMKAKSAVQIRARMKNLKIRDENNPVLIFIREGETVPLEVEHAWEEVGNGTRTLLESVRAGCRQDLPPIWMKKILDMDSRQYTQPKMMLPISPRINQSLSTSISSMNTSLNSTIKVLTLPKQLLTAQGDQIIIINGSSFEVASLSTHCSTQYSLDSPTLPRPIMCLDGNTATPTSTSDSDTPDSGPSNNLGIGAGCKNIARSFSPPPHHPRSPLKRVTLSAHHYHKSPLKAASDRILKKYTSVSPHKRAHRYYSLPPHKRPRRELRKKHSGSPVAQVLTPSRRLAPLAPKRSVTPPCLDVSMSGMSPRSPCLPSPSHEEEEGGTETDTPTILARRKTRHQKETELTLTLLGQLETLDEKEAREGRECQEMFQEISRVLADSLEYQVKFSNIMGQSGTAGTISTYLALRSLLSGHPLVQEMLLDLLTEVQAGNLGTEVYWQHHQRQSMKKFILKLGLAYRHQPAYHARVLREFDSLCQDPTLTPDMLKGLAMKLFKNNQHLLDQFLLLVPGVEPPEGMLPSPEVLHYPEDSDHSWGSEDGLLETVVLKRSPEQSRI